MKSSEKIEQFVDALDRMMESSELMFMEKYNCNYREYNSIKQYKYDPAREELIQSLLDLLELGGPSRPS
jgi:hypothetical protein